MNDDHDLLGAYALGALDQADAARFLEHLSTCPFCETDLWQATIAAHSLAVLDPTRSQFSIQLPADTPPGHEEPEKADPNHPV